MSIIIASLDFENKTVHIGSDRKQTAMSGEPIEEEFTKLFKIKPELYFCMNGHVRNGLALANLLLEKQHLPTSSLIELVSSFVVKRGFIHGKVQGDCAFVMAGIDNEGPFIYVRYTETDLDCIMRAEQGKTMRAIAVPCDETAMRVSDVFYSHLLTGNGHNNAIHESINYASTIDNKVGSTCDYVSITNQNYIESTVAATGTLLVGSASGVNNAGITGVIDKGGDSVRFYAGAPYANKNIAPWRVLDNGKAYASDIIIAFKTTGRRAEFNSENSTYTFYDEQNRSLFALKDNVEQYNDDDPKKTNKTLAGLDFKKYYSSNPSNPDIVRVTGNGIYSNTGFSSIALNQAGTGQTGYGSIVGYVRRAITLAAGNIQAAVIGLSAINGSYGGYFKHVLTGGTAIHLDGKIETVAVNGSVLTGKTGYIVLQQNGNGTYNGLHVVNGLIVDGGQYSNTTYPPGLS